MSETIKKQFLTAISFIFVMSVATVSLANIKDSLHDFSGYGWSDGQICLPCHTPHHANTSVDTAPLWNHEVTQVTNYDLYTGLALNADDMGQPNGVSKLCLSCHDGTVAIDSFGGATGSTMIYDFDPDGSTNLGTDLSNDHPISFSYDNQVYVDDGELFDPDNDPSGLGGTIAQDLLFNGKLECASCHDVHDTADLGNTGHLLVLSNAGSALCLTCHNK